MTATSLYEYPHCGRADCPCAHEPPCRAGWIDTVVEAHGRITQGAKPCPACRPARLGAPEENTDPTFGRARWLDRLRGTSARADANQSPDNW